jgi:hypothetical protein
LQILIIQQMSQIIQIDHTTHYGKAGEEWCLPVRFSVKVSHLSNKMFKI